MSMFLSLRHSKTASFFLSTIFSITEVSPSKRFSSVRIAMSLFLIFIHQNTKSTTVHCIYNILEESFKTSSKFFLIDVDSVLEDRPVYVLKASRKDVHRVMFLELSRTSIFNLSHKFIFIVLF